MLFIVYLCIAFFGGLIVGWILTLVFCAKIKNQRHLQQELDAAKLALSTQKQMIFKHFSHSAEILDKMAGDFRVLYKHMADNSSALLIKEEIEQAQSKFERTRSLTDQDTKSSHDEAPIS